MARAKRTQRAEARRRYRATAALDGPADSQDEETSTPGPGRSPRTTSQPVSRQGAAVTRMPFRAAVRAAVHPVNVRDDIATLPWVVTHSHALWLPLVLTLASTVAIIATNGGDIAMLLFAYFIATPALGGVFIAGFLAPRSSWLLGALVGLFAAGCYGYLVLAFPTSLHAIPPTTEEASRVITEAFIMSPVFGAFLAAAAAWYRRFLRLSAPNRARPSSTPKQRPGDGRTRTSGASQKASAKR